MDIKKIQEYTIEQLLSSVIMTDKDGCKGILYVKEVEETESPLISCSNLNMTAEQAIKSLFQVDETGCPYICITKVPPANPCCPLDGENVDDVISLQFTKKMNVGDTSPDGEGGVVNGEAFTATFTIVNDGLNDAENLVINDNFPECLASDDFPINVGTVPAGQTVTYTATFIPTDCEGDVGNTAVLTGDDVEYIATDTVPLAPCQECTRQFAITDRQSTPVSGEDFWEFAGSQIIDPRVVWSITGVNACGESCELEPIALPSFKGLKNINQWYDELISGIGSIGIPAIRGSVYAIDDPSGNVVSFLTKCTCESFSITLKNETSEALLTFGFSDHKSCAEPEFDLSKWTCPPVPVDGITAVKSMPDEVTEGVPFDVTVLATNSNEVPTLVTVTENLPDCLVTTDSAIQSFLVPANGTHTFTWTVTPTGCDGEVSNSVTITLGEGEDAKTFEANSSTNVLADPNSTITTTGCFTPFGQPKQLNITTTPTPVVDESLPLIITYTTFGTITIPVGMWSQAESGVITVVGGCTAEELIALDGVTTTGDTTGTLGFVMN